MFKRLVIVVTLFLAVVIAGCSGSDIEDAQSQPSQTGNGNNQNSPSVNEGNNEPVMEENLDPVDLVFYSTSGDFATDEHFMEVIGNPIQMQFPHVTPVFILYESGNQLETLITIGENIDILFNSTGMTPDTLLKYNMQFDISELINKYDFDLSSLEPTSIEIQRIFADGGIYGLPVFTTTNTMYYNRDLFDRFGVDYPADDMTWEEVYAMVETMSRSEEGVDYRGLIISPAHSFRLNSLSVPYIDPETNQTTFETDLFRRMLETYTRIYAIDGNQFPAGQASYGRQLATFDSDQTTAAFIGLSTLGAVRFKDTLNWDVASHPVYEDQPNIGPQSYPTHFYITNTSEHKDIAFQVTAYMTSEGFQYHLAREGIMPVLEDTGFIEDFGINVPYYEGKNITALLPKQYASPMPISPYRSIAEPIVRGKYEEVITGQKDINTALREAKEEADKAIADEIANN